MENKIQCQYQARRNQAYVHFSAATEACWKTTLFRSLRLKKLMKKLAQVMNILFLVQIMCFCCRFDDSFLFLGSDGNADLCFTDPEAQSDPQTGSPPREQSAGSRKQTGDNEFSNIMAELSERKSKLFRSSASAAKKKNSLGILSEPTPENSVVSVYY